MERYPHVFAPLTLRGVTLKNRLEFTPFVCSLCDSEGGVTRETIDFIGMQARSGVGNIVVGNIVDLDRGMSSYADLDFMHDRFLQGLSLIAEEAHRYGAKISYEACHSGRGTVPSQQELSAKDTGISDDMPVPQMPPLVNTMTRSDMDWMIERHVDACLRSQRAGFDMIFCHFGHNNLMGTFLSPATNHRTDEYGGSLENRMRFPLEIIRAIREAIGPDMPMEVRVSAEEKTKDGSTMVEALAFLKAAEPYIDMAHLSCGNVFDPESRVFTSPMYTMEHMQNIRYSQQAKQELSIPVAVVGNIFTVADAEDIIASGKADMVGLCRSLLADPELIHKAIAGREETIRPCLRCMDGCGRIFHGLPVRCAVNPVVGRETRYGALPLAKIPKKVMVIGAGPAGMQAAQTLAARGHSVTLYESGEQLGGRLEDAGVVSSKHLMRRYRDWNINTTMNCGAKIVLNTKVTPELVEKEAPDAVIVATGSQYLKPPIPGIDGKHVHMLQELNRSPIKLGETVIVCGGGLSGVEAAVDLAKSGKDVTVIDQISTEQFCSELFFFAYEALFREVHRYGVKLEGNCIITSFPDSGVAVEKEGKPLQLGADSVIIALGLKPENELALQLVRRDPLNTYIVGDAGGIHNIRSANDAAFFAAVEL